MKYKINKKGQIGTTLTWFVAFLIIFFIMMIFISASFVISSRKKVSYGDDYIGIGEETRGLKAQRSLMNLLNSKINKMSFDDYIKNNLKKTPSEWDRKQFDCYKGEANMEINVLDLNNKEVKVQISVCDGKVKKDSRPGTIFENVK